MLILIIVIIIIISNVFNDKEQIIALFEHVKQRMKHYVEHVSDMDNLDDSDYD